MDRFNEAIQDLEAAIARDYPPAFNTLAGIYFRGDGVPVDRKRRVVLWRKGAALGHVPAKKNLMQQLLWGRFGFWEDLKERLCLFDQFTYCGIAVKRENGKMFTVNGLRPIATVKVPGKVTCKNCLRAMG